MISVPMNGHEFSVSKKVFPATITKSQSFMDLVPHLNCLTEPRFRISRVVWLFLKRYVYNVYGLAFALTKVLG
jgi:hypothetical protein